MSLKTLTSILKSGNMALGQKLHNLLTEDCNILEYTDDAVLFQKNNYLVLAKFKHNLAESKMTSDAILDNEVIYVSAKATDRELKESLVKLIDNLVEDDYVTAEEDLKHFCENYYQYQILKKKFPETFTENLIKKSPGFKLRKKGNQQIAEFKSEVFSLATLNETVSYDITDIASIIENCGYVLFLGKNKVIDIVEDALLGNRKVAETLTNKLYDVALTLTEANEDIKKYNDNGYSLEDGKFDNEVPEEIEDEDYNAPEEIEDEFPTEEDGQKDFEEFDISKLTDEQAQELHKTILLSILTAMSEFVSREAINPENPHVSADLDDRLKEDIEMLNDTELAADTLSDIEARWHPVLSSFLDSDLYTPDQDMEAEEIEIKSDIGEPADSIETNEEEAPVGEEQSIPSFEENEERQGPPPAI